MVSYGFPYSFAILIDYQRVLHVSRLKGMEQFVECLLDVGNPLTEQLGKLGGNPLRKKPWIHIDIDTYLWIYHLWIHISIQNLLSIDICRYDKNQWILK